MNIYLFCILIIIVLVILFFLVENKKEILSKLGTVGIVTSISLVVIGVVLKFLFDMFLSDFNVIRISSLIFNKFLTISLLFLGIGLIMKIISKLINSKNKNVSINY